MARRKVTAGITSVAVPIFVQDTSSTTGAGLSGLTSATSGLVGEYRRQGASSWTAITLGSGTLGTWSSGGWVADGSLGGAYEVGIPDAAFASGARWVQVRYRGATSMLPVLLEFELDAVNYQSSTAFMAGINGIAPPSRWATDIIDASGRVDVGSILGTASAGAAGYVGIDWGHVTAPTTAVNLSGTTISTTQAVASVAGSVGSVTDKTGFALNLGQVGLSPRALDSVADGSLTVGDCLVAALCGAVGDRAVVGTTYTVKTPATGTTVVSKALNDGTNPTSAT